MPRKRSHSPGIAPTVFAIIVAAIASFLLFQWTSWPPYAIWLGGWAGATLLLQGKRESYAKVVIAAGVWSKQLLKELNLSVPLAAERGYHLTLPEERSRINNILSSSERKDAHCLEYIFFMSPRKFWSSSSCFMVVECLR